MPFIEITGFDQEDAVRSALASQLTMALSQAFAIDPEIVTLYFHTLQPRDYAHAGVHAPPGEPRTFIKVHAFPREVALKRAAARRMCEAAASVLRVSPKNVIIYFFDRPPHDVAHGGILVTDVTA